MRLRTVGYLAAEAVDGVRKNGVMSLASVTTVALGLFILSVFAVLALNVEHMVEVLRQQVQVTVFLKPSFDRAETEDFLAAVRALPGVEEALFVPREEGLERLKRQFGEQADLLEAVEENNPLRDAVEVRIPEPGAVEGVVARLRALPQAEKVVYQRDTIRRLHNVGVALRGFGLVLAVVLGLATVMIVSNTIRVSVFARRREIGIMKLVGATDSFIRLPFFLEGAMLGLAGSLMAAAALWLGYGWFASRVLSALPFLPILPARPLVPQVVQTLALTGLVLGAGGSVLSLRRHLRV